MKKRLIASVLLVLMLLTGPFGSLITVAAQDFNGPSFVINEIYNDGSTLKASIALESGSFSALNLKFSMVGLECTAIEQGSALLEAQVATENAISVTDSTNINITGDGKSNISFACSPEYGISGELYIVTFNITSVKDYSFNLECLKCYQYQDSTYKKVIPSIQSDVSFDKTTFEKSTWLRYSDSNGEVTITGCNTLIFHKFEIPETLGGFPVKYIANGAFQNCKDLTEIIIPDTVVSIGERAFYNCASLEKIDVSDSIISIGYNAFYGTAFYNNTDNWNRNLFDSERVLYIDKYLIKAENISDKYSVTTGTELIADRAFYNSSIKEISIPDSVKYIGNYAFANCYNLSGVYLQDEIDFESTTSTSEQVEPDTPTEPATEAPTEVPATEVMSEPTVTTITEVESIANKLSAGVISVGQGAFYNCDSLTGIAFMNPETKLGSEVFAYCNVLSVVTLPQNIQTLSQYLFRDCISLVNIDIPESVTTIDYGAFYNCDGLRNIEIHDGVVTIGNYAFYDSDGLESIKIPDSVTAIGQNTFYDCDDLTSVTIGDSVTSIGSYAFYSCDNLRNVTIGLATKSISSRAFQSCTKIEVTYYNGTPEQWNSISIGSYNDYIKQNIVYESGSEIPYIAKGTCGENLTWLLQSDGVLVISGTGDMYDYDYDAPWREYLSQVEKVIIGDNVTSIGDIAFAGGVFSSATIGSSVTDIGDSAFEFCTALESILIPDSVVSIGDLAFYECFVLEDVSIGNNVEVIGRFAFYSTSIETITIPGSVKSIKDRAFEECYLLTDILVDSENTEYSSDEYGVLFSKDKTQLIYYPIGNQRDNYTVPDSVTSIKEWAFAYCDSLTSVTIGEGVTSIGDYAFRSCHSLVNVTIGAGVTSIGNSAFEYCDSLTNVTIPDSVSSIGEVAFSYCTSLTSVAIGDSVTSIGDEAFSYCNSLTSIAIPDSVTDIGNAVFGGCSSLEKIIVNPDNPSFSSNEDGVLFNKNKTVLIQYPIGHARTAYTIPDSVESIGAVAFRKSEKLQSVTLPESITVVQTGAFGFCDALESVKFENSEAIIEEQAFFGCKNLKNMDLGENITAIGECAFFGCVSLESFKIPVGVTTIENKVFYNCSGIKEVYLPVGVKSIGNSAFYNCSNLNNTYYEGNSEQWGMVEISDGNDPLYNNIVFEYASEKPYLANGSCGENLTWILYPDGMLEVKGSGDMYNYGSGNAPWYSYRNKILNIVLSDGITNIGNYAFYNCQSLTSVTIGTGVTSIGNYALQNCYSLTSVTIGDSVTSIGECAFYNCIRLTSIAIPDSVISIGNYAFFNCASLISIAIPGSVTSIGDYAFQICINLKSIIIPVSVTSVGYAAFDGDNLSEAYYSGTPEQWNAISIGSYNDSLINAVKFVIQSGSCGKNLSWLLTDTGEMVIYGTGGMTNYSDTTHAPWFDYKAEINKIIVFEGVTTIGNDTFYGCNNLTELVLPSTLNKLGNTSFRDCTSLKNVSIPDSVTSIGYYAFYGCTALENVDLGNGVTSITNHAFRKCTALEYIVIPESVTNISNNAFEGCANLSLVLYRGNAEQWNDITIGSGNEKITDNVCFVEDSGVIGDIEWLYGDNTLVITGNGAMPMFSSVSEAPWYKYASEIETVIITGGVTSVSQYAFNNYTSLENIVIGDEVCSVGVGAFDNSAYYNNPDNWDNGVLYIGDYLIKVKTTFKGYYTVKEGTRVIADEAFYNCDSLHGIVIPDSVTCIGINAYYSCGVLSWLVLGNGVEAINNNAFRSVYPQHVFYRGAESEFNSIVIGNNNSNLLSATRHYVDSDDIDALISVESTMPTCVSSGIEQVTCLLCDAVIYQQALPIDKSAHSYVDGVCEYCLFKQPEDINVDELKLVEIKNPGESVYFRFVPETSGVYYFYSDSQSDTCGYLCNEFMNQIASNDDGGDDTNFLVSYDLVAGTTYYFSARYYSSSHTGTFSVKISQSYTSSHSYELVEHRDTSCAEEGYAKYQCSVCGIYKTEYLPQLEHTFSEQTVEVTCITDGGTKHVCTVCGYFTIEDVTESATGHNYVDGVCENCGWNEAFEYEILKNGIAITGYNGDDDIVVIPSELCGYSVIEIADYAFENSVFSSVVIPNTVKTIGYRAFYNCYNLISIMIPGCVTSIGAGAFDYCSALKNIAVSEDNDLYSSDENGVLFNKDKTVLIKYPAAKEIVKYTIPDTVARIENEAFWACDNLESIVISDSVENIGYYAFAYCNSLISVYIGKDITSIEDDAFMGCMELERISVSPDNLTYSSDENGVLFNKDKTVLIKYPAGRTDESYTIPDTVIRIEDQAFYNCTKLTSVTITNGVTDIGSYAFSDCYNLEIVVIGDGVERIGYYAFAWCYDLVYIVMGSNVKNIDEGAFEGTNNLKHVFNRGDEEAVASITIDNYNDTLINCTCHYSVTEDIDELVVIETVPATCNKQGSNSHNCLICGEVIATEFISMLEHTGDVVEIVEPICGVSEGYTIYECSVCGERYESDYTWLDHIKGNVVEVVDPVCGESNGYTIYECSACGEIFDNDYIWKDHNAELIEATQATCTQPSFCIYRCVDCGAEYTERDSDALGHLIADGHCTRCETEIPLIKFDELTDVNISTSGEKVYFMFKPETDGTYYFYSDSADDTYGYLYDSDMNELASCDDYDDRNFVIEYDLIEGQTYYIASRYYSSERTGNFKVKVSTEFTSNHSYELIEHRDTSCAEEGYDNYKCTVCGIYNTEYLPQLEHTLSEQTVEATCITDGGTKQVCTVCGYFTIEDVTETATGHNYVGGICTNCGWDEDFEYEILENGIAITGYNGNNDNVVIPSELCGYNVIEIAPAAFGNCDFSSVEIPDTVKTIGWEAFFNCYNLETVIIPDSVEVIGDHAFAMCYNLKYVVMGSGIKQIYDYAFGYDRNLKHIFYRGDEESVEAIVISEGNEALTNCTCHYSVTGDIDELVVIKTVTATCTVEGSIKHTCVLCDEVLYSVNLGIDKSAHSYVDGVCEYCSFKQPEDINVDELKLVEIKNPGDSVCFRFVPETSGEYYFFADTKYSTWGYLYNSDMSELSYYINSGYMSDDEYVDTTHDGYMSYNLVAGKTYYISFSCYDDSYVADFYVMVTENFVSRHTEERVTEIVQPTCTQGGYTLYYCSVCGGEYEKDEVDALGHIKGNLSMIVEPSCDREGYIVYNCERCQDSYITDYTEPLEHQMTEQSVEATCITDGGTKHVCTVCGYFEIEDVTEPATGHNYVDGICTSCGWNEDFEYEILDNGIAITGYYGNDDNVVIPEELCGYDVIEIASEAFWNCDFSSVEIPDTVRRINTDAFIACRNLETVTIPDSVEVIADLAFDVCTGLTSVYIGKGVTTMGDAAFCYCPELESITVSVDNTMYSSDENGVLFNKDKSVLIKYPDGKTATSYTIPVTVKIIGCYAFYNCANLETVIIPDSVENIENYAFVVCNNLKHIVMGSGIKKIDDYAFEGDSNLRHVFYRGDEESVATIVIGEGNEALTNSTCHYSVTGDIDELIVIEIVPATCTEPGSNVHKCTICNEVIWSEYISVTHSYDIIETTQATCTKPSYNVYKCCDCGVEYAERVSNALGHTIADGLCTRCDTVVSEIKLNELTDVNITANGEKVYFKFTPEADGTYYFYSDSNYDTYGYLYDSDMNELASSDDYEDNNFVIAYELIAGQVYYVAARYYSSDYTGSFKIRISDEFTSNHSYNIETVLPTCCNSGFDFYVCSVCGKAEERNYVDPTGHNYVNGICKVCGCHDGNHMLDVEPSENSTAIVDHENKLIYGLASGLGFEDFVTCFTFCEEVQVDSNTEQIGTGTKIIFTNFGNFLDEYSIIIFGDVNGDGWYDGQDAIIVDCLASGMLTHDDVSEAVYMAADCNHDGVIDQLDVDLLNQAGILLANVDQSKPAEVLLETSSEYVAYLDLIDQSPEIEVEDNTDSNVPESDDTEEGTPEEDTEDSIQLGIAEVDIFEMIINFIKSVFEMLLAYIPVSIK